MSDAIELTIDPRPRDLGGFSVHRVLPYMRRRMVGPFVFFDHIGPADFAPGTGVDVRPHPHIGLATVTYLFSGELFHRDSLGFAQAIRPGDVNWMTAGRGIVHSERTPPEPRARGQHLHGIQSWVALPKTHEATDSAFVHHPAASLPAVARDGVRLTLIAGSAFGATSPVATLWPTLYADAVFAPGGRLTLPSETEERAIYVVEGDVRLDGAPVAAGTMAVLRPGTAPVLSTQAPARIMLLGGAAMDGPRTIWWNFVASDETMIDAARARWRDGGFARVPGEDEFIPLPED